MPTTTTPVRAPSIGGAVCAWIEAFCVHGEGDFFGKPFILDPFQKRFIWRLYEYDPDTYRRLVRRALLVLPKGCGKTELVAAICVAELFGPTQPSDEGPVQRTSPNIPIAAASFEQSDRLYGAARTMVAEGPLSEFIDTFEKEMLLKDRPGRMFRVAAVAGTNDGGLPTCFGADEIHEWTGKKERVHLVIGNSLAKRADGLELNITTPDDANPESLLGKMRAYGERVNAGEIKDPSFLYVHHAAGMDWDLDEPDQLRQAIREATPASWMDPERIAARYEIDRIPEHEFRRYHLAQFVRASGSWLPAGSWENLQTCSTPPKGTDIVLGFDGSYRGDATALIGASMDGELFIVGLWENPDDENWRVPRSEVKAKVKEAFDTWTVRELACDPFGWFDEVEEWEDTYRGVVVRFETNQRKRMANAASRFYTGVAQGLIRHDHDPALSRHLHNVVVKETTSGQVITKEHPNSPRKIDAAVAAVIAYDRAMWHATNQAHAGVSFLEAGPEEGKKECSKCGGSGLWDFGGELEDCAYCGGQGTV